MENSAAIHNRPGEPFIVRKKRIQKLERYGLVWGYRSSEAKANSRREGEKEHETKSQSLSYKDSGIARKGQLPVKPQLKFKPQPRAVPHINQDVLQQELIKMFRRQHSSTCLQSERKVTQHGYNSLNIIKDDLKHPNDLSPNDNSTGDWNMVKLRIKKPAKIESCRISAPGSGLGASPVDLGTANGPATDAINFGALKELLLLLFTHQLSDIDTRALRPHEAGIFQAVLERKNYSLSGAAAAGDSYPLGRGVSFSPRRSEEKFKFIIKRIIKYLKKRDKIKSEHEFYRLYFSDLSDRLGVPLNHFYDPHNKLLKNQHFKSLSTDYVMLLLKSELFLVELLFYLENHIIKDHIEALDTKVANLCRKWENTYETLQDSQKPAEYIKQLILNTEKGSKLPWSVGEVKEAVELMRNIIYSWNSQKFIR